jgi:hypothetical protein
VTVSGSFWPSRTQELLLATGLAQPADGLVAWKELQPGFELTKLEIGTIGVLPLVYRVVAGALPENPLLPRLKGIYRSTWVKNNLLSERLRELMSEFEDADTELVMIGSLAAAVRFYPELALRPTTALDFLIRPESVRAAVRALGRLGFSAPHALAPERLRELTLSNAQGESCVLRTAAPFELSGEEKRLRANSVSVEVGNRVVRALAPEDDLLLACVLGARTKPVRSVQWLVDIVQIARRDPGSLDWARIVELGRARGQALRLRQTFEYLSGVVGLEVPAQLHGISIPARERLAYACAGARVGPLGTLPQALAEHLADSRDRSPVRAAAEFPGFLRARWQLEHGWQLPLAGSRRAYEALSGRRARYADDRERQP